MHNSNHDDHRHPPHPPPHHHHHHHHHNHINQIHKYNHQQQHCHCHHDGRRRRHAHPHPHHLDYHCQRLLFIKIPLLLGPRHRHPSSASQSQLHSKTAAICKSKMRSGLPCRKGPNSSIVHVLGTQSRDMGPRLRPRYIHYMS